MKTLLAVAALLAACSAPVARPQQAAPPPENGQGPGATHARALPGTGGGDGARDLVGNVPRTLAELGWAALAGGTVVLVGGVAIGARRRHLGRRRRRILHRGSWWAPRALGPRR